MSEQKKIKPKIEDVGQYLTPDRAAAMLSLVEFVRANKIGVQHNSGQSWKLTCKGKGIGALHIHDGTWRFAQNCAYIHKYYEMEEGDLKSFAFDHIYAKTCGDCQWNPSAQKAGYMNPTGCGCWPLRIFNPDGEVLEYTKQLIEYMKNCVIEEWQAAKS
ncbi:MAG: hypothetical protein FWE06_09370 [Oscillospiraceae bacterium]|nr:hypothetical protein [Oscillospiraceae bacterium]